MPRFSLHICPSCILVWNSIVSERVIVASCGARYMVCPATYSDDHIDKHSTELKSCLAVTVLIHVSKLMTGVRQDMISHKHLIDPDPRSGPDDRTLLSRQS